MNQHLLAEPRLQQYLFNSACISEIDFTDIFFALNLIMHGLIIQYAVKHIFGSLFIYLFVLSYFKKILWCWG